MSAPEASSAGCAAAPTLALQRHEAVLVQLLADTCDWLAQTQPQPPPPAPQVHYHPGWTCEARIAGGWVRDCLLEQPSADLDIALSTLTGHTFALLLREYLASPQYRASSLAQQPELQHAAMGSIARIEANPEQSKNLETATVQLLGLSLDFVNLRKEVYEGESRIPSMTFGTASEDAVRRDLTINALFYNVHTRRVEDLTERGLSDLRERRIRTPLEPQRTFLDDPLRVLRCVRFAARLGYTLDEAILGSMCDGAGDEVRAALRTKVSRERVGIEVDKMLYGPNPLRALELLHKLGLYNDVFAFPASDEEMRRLPFATSKCTKAELGPQCEPIPVEAPLTALRCARIVDALCRQAAGAEARPESPFPAGFLAQLPQSFLAPLTDREERRRLFMLFAMPLQGRAVVDGKSAWCWAGERVIANGLKLGVKTTRSPLAALNSARDLLDTAVSGVRDCTPYVESLKGLGSEEVSDDAVLMLVAREKSISLPELKLSLPTALLAAYVARLAKAWGPASVQAPDADHASVLPESELQAITRAYVAFHERITALDATERALEKPALDGNSIAKAVGMPSLGRLTPRIQTRVLAWQYSRPRAAHDDAAAQEALRAECAAWLGEAWQAGGVVPREEREALLRPPEKVKGRGQQDSAAARKRQKSE